MRRRFFPPARCAARSPRRRTSRSPTARRCSAAMTCDRADRRTTSTPRTRRRRSPPSRRSARRCERRMGRSDDPRRRPARRRARGRRDRRRQRRDADAAAAGLAGRRSRAGAGRSTATSRSAAARWTGSPSRCGGWARTSTRRDDRFAPFTVAGSPLAAIAYALPVASAQVKSCVLLAGLRRRADAVIEPAPSRDHTERLLLRAASTWPRRRGVSRPQDELELARPSRPGDPSSAAFHVAAAVLVPGSRTWSRTWPPTGPASASCASSSGWARSLVGELEPARAPLSPDEPVDGARRRPRPARRHDGRGRGGPAGDRRAAARGAARLLRRGRDRGARAARAARQGDRPDRERRRRPARARRRDRGHGRRLRRAGHRRPARRHDRLPRRPRLAMLGAVAGLASREGVEVDGMEAAAVSYPGFEADLAAWERHVAPRDPVLRPVDRAACGGERPRGLGEHDGISAR